MSNIYNIIVAHDLNYGIGVNNTLPWYSPIDLNYFKTVTKNHSCIMGRSTYESILDIRGESAVDKNGLLPNRNCYVLSTTLKHARGCLKVFNNIHELNEFNSKNETFFIIGGATIYQQFINDCDELFISEIQSKYNCDTFFYYPTDMNKFELVSTSIQFDGVLQSDIKFYRYKKLKENN